MKHFIFILMLVAAVPYGVRTWWRMRMARGPRERAFIGRSAAAIAMLTVLGVSAVVMLTARGQLFALPLVGVIALGIRHGYRKVHTRIQAEEGDPVRRAKRVN